MKITNTAASLLHRANPAREALSVLVRCKFLLPLLLVACSPGPTYVRPDTIAVTGSSTYEHSEGAAVQEGSSARWWKSYHDPLLDAWIARLESENLELKAAAERVLQARQRVRIQQGGLWPSLGVSGGSVRSFGPDLAMPGERSYNTSIEAGGAISWQIDLFERTRNAVESARFEELARVGDHRALLQTLVAELVSQRATLALLDREVEIQREIVLSREQTLNTVSRRYRLGVKNASAVGVHTAIENLSSAQADLLLLQQRGRETRVTVDVLLNQQPGTLQADSAAQEARSFALVVPQQMPTLQTPAALLDQRPDIISSELRLMAANADIGIAIADLFPDLTLSANRGFSSDDVSNLFKNNNAVGFLAGNISARIFEGGRLRAQIRLREAQARELTLQYSALVLTAVAEVETALVQEQYLRQRLDKLNAGIKAARQADALAQDRYRRGIESLVVVLETQRRRQNAERNLLAAQRASWQARINLHLALGGDWGNG